MVRAAVPESPAGTCIINLSLIPRHVRGRLRKKGLEWLSPVRNYGRRGEARGVEARGSWLVVLSSLCLTYMMIVVLASFRSCDWVHARRSVTLGSFTPHLSAVQDLSLIGAFDLSSCTFGYSSATSLHRRPCIFTDRLEWSRTTAIGLSPAGRSFCSVSVVPGSRSDTAPNGATDSLTCLHFESLQHCHRYGNELHMGKVTARGKFDTALEASEW